MNNIYAFSKNSSGSHIKSGIRVSNIAKVFENLDITPEKTYEKSSSQGKVRPSDLNLNEVLKQGSLYYLHY